MNPLFFSDLEGSTVLPTDIVIYLTNILIMKVKPHNKDFLILDGLLKQLLNIFFFFSTYDEALTNVY